MTMRALLYHVICPTPSRRDEALGEGSLSVIARSDQVLILAVRLSLSWVGKNRLRDGVMAAENIGPPQAAFRRLDFIPL